MIDWALAERLSLASRRDVVMLALMMNLRNRDGVTQAVRALCRDSGGRRAARERLIDRCVNQFFERMPADHTPGTLDAMRLLDEVALEGVHFPPPLFLFRKILFTLDGVLHEVAGQDVHIDRVITREFLARWLASFGLFHSPLGVRDLVAIEWNTLLYPVRSWAPSWASRLMGGPGTCPTEG